MKIRLTLLLVFPILFGANAQRANTWYFGNNAGLSFNTSPPSILTNGVVNNPDNISTISNSGGSLLFYTDGMTVWNSLHQVMTNGSGLIGNFTAGQCALIVPVPCDTNKYVIFHVTEFSSPGQLRYSVVDMTLSGGLGGVSTTQKNVSLGTGWTEKLCAYYNSVGNFYWVLSHKWNSDQFVAFNVTTNAIATQTVISAVGGNHTCGSYSAAHDALGQLTISPDGTKVINAFTCQDKYELFDFNSVTGVVSNPIVLPSQGGKAWGTAFSPDSKKVFTSSIFGQKILQYDLNVFNQTAIVASETTLVTVPATGYIFGYMELGPDGKLYITRPGTNFLAVVNNPNILGAGSNFSLAGQSLGIKVSTHGLSRIAYNIPGGFSPGGNPVTAVANPSTLCAGQQSTLQAGGAGNYLWSNSASSPSTTVSPVTTSIYTVTGTSAGTCFSAYGNATVMVIVNPLPNVSILGNPIVCLGQSTTLTATGAQAYFWNIGSTNPILVVTPVINTSISVIGTSAGCSNSSTIVVSIQPTPVVSISGNTLVCYGKSSTLTAFGAVNYQWSTGASIPTIVVNPMGTTTYTVAGSAGTTPCAGNAAITVSVSECLGYFEAINAQSTVQIQSNPFSNELAVKSEILSNKNTQIKIVNLDGREVYSGVAAEVTDGSGLLLLKLENLSSGIYFFVLQSGDQVLTQKIVKIKE